MVEIMYPFSGIQFFLSSKHRYILKNTIEKFLVQWRSFTYLLAINVYVITVLIQPHNKWQTE
jgi:hypothetical protein